MEYRDSRRCHHTPTERVRRSWLVGDGGSGGSGAVWSIAAVWTRSDETRSMTFPESARRQGERTTSGGGRAIIDYEIGSYSTRVYMCVSSVGGGVRCLRLWCVFPYCVSLCCVGLGWFVFAWLVQRTKPPPNDVISDVETKGRRKHTEERLRDSHTIWVEGKGIRDALEPSQTSLLNSPSNVLDANDAQLDTHRTERPGMEGGLSPCHDDAYMGLCILPKSEPDFLIHSHAILILDEFELTDVRRPRRCLVGKLFNFNKEISLMYKLLLFWAFVSAS